MKTKETKETKIFAEYLEYKALEQFTKAMNIPCNVQGALMPDAHCGYTLPIGSVIKSKGKIFPAYVGYDIGCGMTAIRTSINEYTKEQLEEIKKLILDIIPIGRNQHQIPQKTKKYDCHSKKSKVTFGKIAPNQIGTLGGGNHFIELGIDDSGFINVVIHSGSRGVGHKIATEYMNLAASGDFNVDEIVSEFEKNNKEWIKSIKDGKVKNLDHFNKTKDKFISQRIKNNLKTNIEGHYGFDIGSEYGQSYIKDMNAALEFALDNREYMLKNILKCMEQVFGKFETSRFINRNHNHAEIKDGFVIHRKGATHAETGMLGVIPGNMKDGSFIVRGKGNPESLCSSSHGAGRVLSRKVAKDTLSVYEFDKMMEDIVTNHTDSTIDESPNAYKNIFDVMEQQKELVEVIDRVIPILNIKG